MRMLGYLCIKGGSFCDLEPYKRCLKHKIIVDFYIDICYNQ